MTVDERQFTTMLIECIERFTPQEKAEANAELVRWCEVREAEANAELVRWCEVREAKANAKKVSS